VFVFVFRGFDVLRLPEFVVFVGELVRQPDRHQPPLHRPAGFVDHRRPVRAEQQRRGVHELMGGFVLLLDHHLIAAGELLQHARILHLDRIHVAADVRELPDERRGREAVVSEILEIPPRHVLRAEQVLHGVVEDGLPVCTLPEEDHELPLEVLRP
jgi:hypothetical protein